MMEEFKKFDQWLIDSFYQKISDKVWEYIPLSCFSLAKICICCSGGFDLMYIVPQMQWGVEIILGIGVVGSLFLFSEIEKKCKSKFLNPNRYVVNTRFTVWMMFVFSIPFQIFHPDISAYFWPFFISAWYFVACQPRPPIERFYRKLAFE